MKKSPRALFEDATRPLTSPGSLCSIGTEFNPQLYKQSMLALRQLMNSEPQLKVRSCENGTNCRNHSQPGSYSPFHCFTGHTTHLLHGQQHQRF